MRFVPHRILRTTLLKKPPTHSLASQVCAHDLTSATFAAVELSRHVHYSGVMAPKSLLQHNPHLRNAKEYQRALRASVLSSIAIEGVKKAAERALSPVSGKQTKKTR